MKKWSNLRNTEAGRYKLSTMVLAIALAGMILWQGVFAMLGTTSVDADAFAMFEAFSALPHDGLHEQRAVAWRYAVRNPSAEGGVWGQFWETAHFGTAGSEAVPTPTPAPMPTPTPTPAQLPPLPDLPNPGLTSTFTDSRGIVWRVIANDRDAALIMTEHVHMPYTPYNLENVYTRLSESHLRTALNDWGTENLAPELAARARLPYNVDNDVRAAPGTHGWQLENGEAGWTSPGATAANAPGALFVLSVSELNRYASAVGSTLEERTATDTNDTAIGWRLRSPGNNVDTPTTRVNSRGNVNAPHAHEMIALLGARPALWITR